MLVRHFHEGSFWIIEVPDGTRIERLSHIPTASGDWLSDVLFIPWDGVEVPVPAEPPGVLPLLANEAMYGLRVVAAEATAEV